MQAKLLQSRMVVAWLIFVVVLIGCAGPSSGSTRSGQDSGAAVTSRGPKRIVAAIQGEPVAFSTTINPSASAGSVPGSDALEDLLHAGLANHNNEGRLVARLAEAVPTVENGLWRVFPDGRMETAWHLREGAEWHDGKPFTVDDFLFTLRVGREREIALFWNPAYEAVESVMAPDARTIVVRWSRPYVDADVMFTRQLAMPLPSHLLSDPYDERACFTEHPYWLGQFVGTGPFKLRMYQPGSHLVLAASERYLLGRPKIDEVEVKFIPDAQALITSVVAGAAELTMGARVSLDLAVQAGDQWRDGKVDFGPGGWVVVYPQLLSPQPAIVAEVRFRRALLHAIDRQELVDSLMFGRTTVIHSPVAPNHPGYRETEASQVRYYYDPRRAAQLIMGLFFNPSRTLIGNRVVNVSVRGPFSTEAWNANEWDVR